MSEKIKGNMSITEVVMTMSGGNPSVMAVIVKMLEKPAGMLDILMLDSLDIRGTQLYMLCNDCCDCNPDKFRRTLMMIRCGTFTQEQIHANLKRWRALPFMDESIEIDGVPSFDENFGPSHPKWDEWCKAQRESFERRMTL